MEMHLTDKQVSNWRRVLSGTLGPYALLMPKEDIEEFAKRLQEQAFAATNPVEKEKQFCECDKSYYGATIRKDGIAVCNHCKNERIGER